MLVVKKFGGTSVADKERIMNVARRCIAEYKEGNDVVVVLSAMGKQTDVLIDMAKDINPNPPRRELDMLMTTGEQISVAMMAMAMDSLGVPCVSLNAYQVAMHTTSVYAINVMASPATTISKSFQKPESTASCPDMISLHTISPT